MASGPCPAGKVRGPAPPHGQSPLALLLHVAYTQQRHTQRYRDTQIETDMHRKQRHTQQTQVYIDTQRDKDRHGYRHRRTNRNMQTHRQCGHTQRHRDTGADIDTYNGTHTRGQRIKYNVSLKILEEPVPHPWGKSWHREAEPPSTSTLQPKGDTALGGHTYSSISHPSLLCAWGSDASMPGQCLSCPLTLGPFSTLNNTGSYQLD